MLAGQVGAWQRSPSLPLQCRQCRSRGRDLVPNLRGGLERDRFETRILSNHRSGHQSPVWTAVKLRMDVCVFITANIKLFAWGEGDPSGKLAQKRRQANLEESVEFRRTQAFLKITPSALHDLGDS